VWKSSKKRGTNKEKEGKKGTLACPTTKRSPPLDEEGRKGGTGPKRRGQRKREKLLYEQSRAIAVELIGGKKKKTIQKTHASGRKEKERKIRRAGTKRRLQE